jgi:hypothetical protein
MRPCCGLDQEHPDRSDPAAIRDFPTIYHPMQLEIAATTAAASVECTLPRVIRAEMAQTFHQPVNQRQPPRMRTNRSRRSPPGPKITSLTLRAESGRRIRTHNSHKFLPRLMHSSWAALVLPSIEAENPPRTHATARAYSGNAHWGIPLDPRVLPYASCSLPMRRGRLIGVQCRYGDCPPCGPIAESKKNPQSKGPPGDCRTSAYGGGFRRL